MLTPEEDIALLPTNLAVEPSEAAELNLEFRVHQVN